ncbi:GTP cyclohydrolase II-domain-containing protein [Tuber borchii]|uniref:GTP cyclohydrolase II n=1 Tax=Tuber borchii TaxID=42251 RepID=A0A2T7A5I9_TUBBO|nr:GTP cyclohydrolase II-domain-containing protein [Tuber borchii]
MSALETTTSSNTSPSALNLGSPRKPSSDSISIYSPKPKVAGNGYCFSGPNSGIDQSANSITPPAHASPTLLALNPMSRSDSTMLLGPEGQVPPSILSPAFTPPTTPSTPLTGPVASKNPPRLMEELPKVNCIVRARIPTTTGTEIFLHLYQNSIDNKEHLAIVFGNKIRSRSLDAPREGETELDRMIRGAYTGRLFPGRTSSRVDDSPISSRVPSRAASSTSLSNMAPITQLTTSESNIRTAPLVRIHSECYTGEIAWSARCDCGEQLDEAARLMSLDPAGGVVVYLRQEGRGIGLGEKLKAYNLQDLGNDTVQANLILRHPADARSYGLATAILMDLESVNIRLLTNNPEKIAAVEGPGKEVKVVERVPMIPLAWQNLKGGVTGKEVGDYLRAKITQMGHLLALPVDGN